MIDWRRTRHRRTGERIGDRIYEGILWIAIVAVLLYGSWQFGRFFGEGEARSALSARVERAEKDLIAFKIWHYGQDNYYRLDEKGRLRYVTKPGDIDNPKKWRRTR